MKMFCNRSAVMADEVIQVAGSNDPWQVDNPSWAHGLWHIEYSREKDTYIIKTEYGVVVGEIYPTLPAWDIVRMNNYFWELRRKAEHERMVSRSAATPESDRHDLRASSGDGETGQTDPDKGKDN